MGDNIFCAGMRHHMLHTCWTVGEFRGVMRVVDAFGGGRGKMWMWAGWRTSSLADYLNTAMRMHARGLFFH